eukprot:TRINITY_DN26437_c0_g1_i1.p5 TRINITY_DN26437_c0_g1~~TRINITY_DN26437_c0_g1_i1.p5  ORF type:complete len:185 (-),score=6.84 TRINITY_DN26437_c0_g1_i1:326-880(-)
MLFQGQVDVQQEHRFVVALDLAAQHLVRAAQVIGGQGAVEGAAEEVGQGADAGVEQDVADLAHGLLFQLGQLLQGEAVAHHAADDFQALFLGEDEEALGVEGAGESLGHGADLVAVAEAELLHGLVPRDQLQGQHRQLDLLIDHAGQAGCGLADADIEGFHQGVALQLVQFHVSGFARAGKEPL